jgi:peroxiredoxin
MAEKTILYVGETAPDFVLKDQDKQDVQLSGFKGRRVLLSFHPLAWTGVCAEQMKSLESHEAAFAALNAVPLGLSIDHVPSKAAWAKTLSVVKTRLLADFWPHGAVAQAYGLFREKYGSSERANVIVDGEGRVALIKVYEIPQLPDIREILDFISRM